MCISFERVILVIIGVCLLAIEYSTAGIYTESLLLENITPKVIAFVVEAVTVAYLVLVGADLVVGTTRVQTFKASWKYLGLSALVLVGIVLIKGWAVDYYRQTEIKFAACGFYQSGCIIVREYKKP